ncbi:MAG: glycosyltransferase family 39 protein, partial [Verrucomicrobiales bacterium]|nr:glycosyltransferase family 39 protein [Verrucomicrobiales bacterium]
MAPSSSSPDRPDGRDPASSRTILIGLLGYALVLFAVRCLGPSNLTDNDQERPASYVLDAVVNGHWIVQYDWTGDITSKPPAYTWLAGAITAATGGPSLWALYLPCALAMFGAAALIAREAARAFGARTALWTGLFALANPLSAKLVALARTDPLFTFAVTWTAVLAFRAWRKGRGWEWAWFAAALATLTKGPLGLVLGFAGTLAWLRERRPGAPTPFGRGHLAGVAVWLALGLGWFALAWS